MLKRNRKGSSKRLDIHRTVSDLPGMQGFLDGLIKKFRNVAFLLSLSPILGLYIIAMGTSFILPSYVFMNVHSSVQGWAPFCQAVAYGMTLGASFFMYGFVLIFVIPILNLPIKPFVKPGRMIQFDIRVAPWYYHNALTYLVRWTFLEFITPTPLNVLYFRMMGMKIGKGVMINTSNISDPCLITLDDYVTLGGSATIFAHYGMQGFLILNPVHIKRNTTIGLKASVMGGVIVGEGNVIAPHTVLLPKTVVPNKGEALSKSEAPKSS